MHRTDWAGEERQCRRIQSGSLTKMPRLGDRRADAIEKRTWLAALNGEDVPSAMGRRNRIAPCDVTSPASFRRRTLSWQPCPDCRSQKSQPAEPRRPSWTPSAKDQNTCALSTNRRPSPGGSRGLDVGESTLPLSPGGISGQARKMLQSTSRAQAHSFGIIKTMW